jgi:hypothetical protein
MDTSSEAIGGLFFSIIFAIIIFFIAAALLRWIFGIDEIIKLLKQIAKTGKSDLRLNCSVCGKEYPVGELVKIDSGQLICPVCYKVFEKKRQVKL